MSKELAEHRPEVQKVNVADAKDAMRAFEKFKADVLTGNDFYEQGGKRYVRKSGWMKYAMALSITTQIVEERSESIKFKGEEVLAYHFKAVATAPNGRFAEAIGSASSDEGKPWTGALHSIRAMAQTRATERAISNLVGGGEVGADELDTKTVDTEYRVKKEDSYKRDSATLHDAHDEESAVSLEQDIIDAVAGAGLDPNGIEVTRGKDWGQFIIKPNWPKPAQGEESPWRKYADALQAFGVHYHGAKEKDTCKPEYLYNWTIGVA